MGETSLHPCLLLSDGTIEVGNRALVGGRSKAKRQTRMVIDVDGLRGLREDTNGK